MLTSDGQILTNLHVVEGHEWVLLFLRPPVGQEFGKAYVGMVNRTDGVADLALLKMIDPPSDLQTIPLGDIASVEVGEDVHAIGHPVGETWTYTKGLVSQVRSAYEWTIEGVAHKATVLQTQTPINPGNSGGPLFDDDGRLVGINTFVNVEAQGINYAVGVDEIRTFLSRKSSRSSLKKAAPAWTPKDEFETADRNEDGRTDLWARDDDGDGNYEYMMFDEDFDGLADGAFIDQDDNGKAEGLALDSDGDGKFDSYKMDVDEDGSWDEYVMDRDMDGVPEYVRRL